MNTDVYKRKPTDVKKDEKNYLHYILDNNIISHVPADYFEDGDIKKIYQVIKNYHFHFHKKPSKTEIWNELDTDQLEGFEIKRSFFDLVFDRNEYDQQDSDYKEKKFEKWKLIKDAKNKVLEDIEVVHSNDIEEYKKRGLIPFEEEVVPDIEEPLEKTPIFSHEIYDTIPEFFKKCLVPFSKDRERDVLFLSELTELSNLFPKYKGKHNGDIIYSNLYTMIVAPPSSGKGVMSHANKTIALIKQKFEKEFIEKKEHFFHSENKKEEEMPLYKNITLPSNISKSAMIQQLKNNDGCGIMFSTEINSMVKNLSNDWGDIETILNLCFHHDNIDTLRNDKRIEITEPKLSLLFSGPFRHSIEFIKNSESGLYSRFIYYCFKGEQKWEILNDNDDNISNTEYFSEEMAKVLLNIYNEMNDVNYSFHFTDEQFKTFDEYFGENFKFTTTQKGVEIESMVKRMALIFRKICMIFTILREFENPKRMFSDNVKLYCKDIDFKNTMEIVKVLQKHSELMFDNLKQDSLFKVITDPKQKVFALLNDEFKRGDVKDVAKEHNITISIWTMDRYFKEMVKQGYLIKADKYTFKKIKNN